MSLALANRNDSDERHLQTLQNAASWVATRIELRLSSAYIVSSGWE